MRLPSATPSAPAPDDCAARWRQAGAPSPASPTPRPSESPPRIAAAARRPPCRPARFVNEPLPTPAPPSGVPEPSTIVSLSTTSSRTVPDGPPTLTVTVHVAPLPETPVIDAPAMAPVVVSAKSAASTPVTASENVTVNCCEELGATVAAPTRLTESTTGAGAGGATGPNAKWRSRFTPSWKLSTGIPAAVSWSDDSFPEPVASTVWNDQVGRRAGRTPGRACRHLDAGGRRVPGVAHDRIACARELQRAPVGAGVDVDELPRRRRARAAGGAGGELELVVGGVAVADHRIAGRRERERSVVADVARAVHRHELPRRRRGRAIGRARGEPQVAVQEVAIGDHRVAAGIEPQRAVETGVGRRGVDRHDLPRGGGRRAVRRARGKPQAKGGTRLPP